MIALWNPQLTWNWELGTKKNGPFPSDEKLRKVLYGLQIKTDYSVKRKGTQAGKPFHLNLLFIWKQFSFCSKHCPVPGEILLRKAERLFLPLTGLPERRFILLMVARKNRQAVHHSSSQLPPHGYFYTIVFSFPLVHEIALFTGKKLNEDSSILSL